MGKPTHEDVFALLGFSKSEIDRLPPLFSGKVYIPTKKRIAQVRRKLKYSKLSSRKIAVLCGVDEAFVLKMNRVLRRAK